MVNAFTALNARKRSDIRRLVDRCSPRANFAETAPLPASRAIYAKRIDGAEEV
jgi:hypothetical protein